MSRLSPGTRPPPALHFRYGNSPADDIRFEEDLLVRAARGNSSVLVHSWDAPAMVIGRAQPASDIDLRACRAAGIPVLRRATGGTGVLHHRDLAVAVVVPASHAWARAGIPDMYDRFLDVIGDVLAALGARLDRPPGPVSRPARPRSPVCFEDAFGETLAIDGRKVVGCAQARRRDAALVHAEILVSLDANLQARAFGLLPDRIVAAMAPLPLPAPDRHAIGNALGVALASAISGP